MPLRYLCEYYFDLEEPTEPGISKEHIIYATTGDPPSGENHRLVLRKNLKTNKFEVIQEYFVPKRTKEAFSSKDYLKVLDFINKENQKYWSGTATFIPCTHQSGASDELCPYIINFPSQRRLAILIGNSQYESSFFTELRFSENDVNDLQAILIDPSIGGFHTVISLINKTNYEVLRNLEKVLLSASRTDMVLIYYSGHATLDRIGKLYLVTTNTDNELLQSTSIPISTISDLLNNSSCVNFVILLDCCYSGAASLSFKNVISDELSFFTKKSRGIYLITSSTAFSVSRESEEYQRGVFTHHIIEGLSSGNADIDGDGLISMDDLYRYVFNQMSKEPGSRPMRMSSGVGKPYIALYKRRKLKEVKSEYQKALQNEEFVNQVGELYHILGYEVKQNVNLSGRQIDLLVTYTLPGGIESRIAVECEYLREGLLQVERFTGVINSLIDLKKNNEVEALMIITNRGFARNVWNIADEHKISLRTYEELRKQISISFPQVEIDSKIENRIQILCPPISIKKLILKNIKCFEDAEFSFLEKGTNRLRSWTVLVGDNGVGKTTILQCIALCALGPELASRMINLPQNLLRKGTKEGFIKAIFSITEKIGIQREITVHLAIEGKNQYFTTSEDFEIKQETNYITRTRKKADFKGWFVASYGPSRNIFYTAEPLKIGQQNAFIDRIESLFEPTKILMEPSYLNMLLMGDLSLFKALNAPPKMSEETINPIIQILEKLFQEISFPREFSQSFDSEGYVITDFGKINISELSEGYKSMFSWLVHLIINLLYSINWEGNIRDIKGIVLVDEIDLHLHPSWQQKLIPQLKDAFPNLQFITTTHAPMTVGAIETDSIILLEQEKENIKIISDLPSIEGWRADQILTSQLFALTTSRKLEIQKELDEYVKLYGQFLNNQLEDEKKKERLEELEAKLGKILKFPGETQKERMAYYYRRKKLEQQIDKLSPEERKKLLDAIGESVSSEVEKNASSKNEAS